METTMRMQETIKSQIPKGYQPKSVSEWSIEFSIVI